MKFEIDRCLAGVICIGVLGCGNVRAASFASRVVEFEPGAGFATEFGSGLGFTNATAALGEPTRMTTGDFGGPVDPFAPPFQREQLLSLGAGGMITLEFETPIFDNPGNPFGIDFMIFGNSGFVITNGDFSGGGITDGSMFGSDTAEVRISVSRDHETYFTLNPELAPAVDGLYPTDGMGDFTLPVDPAVRAANFDGAGLDGIRAIYGGSGGGAGYDLSWALGSGGEAVEIDWVRFVRIEVLDNKSEIDAVSVVSPRLPSTRVLVREDFSQDPLSNDWEVFGDASLFAWNPTDESISVTWDSSRENSYFHYPLPAPLTTSDDFTIEFDLQLDTIEIGVDPEKPFTFPIAIGLLNLAQATRDDFFRGTGINAQHGPRGVVEWNYLPDSGFGATVSSGLISLDNQWAFQNTFPLEVEPGPVYHIVLRYSAASETLSTIMTRDDELFGPINDATLSDIFGNPLAEGFTEINVDTLSISSYSDAGQNPPEFSGSLLASGRVDNFLLESGSSLQIADIGLEGNQVAVSIAAAAGWDYWLERTSDFSDWTTSAQISSSASEMAVLVDRGPFVDRAFYRIRGRRR